MDWRWDRPARGSPTSDLPSEHGVDSAGASPRAPSPGAPPLLTGTASCRSTESVNRMQSCFNLFISFFILFLPAFFNIVYILCIIAFGASSFYSFLYQKCTTLLSSFELLECCLFQMGKLSKKKDTHCALFFI